MLMSYEVLNGGWILSAFLASKEMSFLDRAINCEELFTHEMCWFT